MPQSKRYGRNGSLNQKLRYAPLTLSTLAALVPQELDAEIICIDEWGEDFDPQTITADLVGITVITGTANRSIRTKKHCFASLGADAN